MVAAKRVDWNAVWEAAATEGEEDTSPKEKEAKSEIVFSWAVFPQFNKKTDNNNMPLADTAAANKRSGELPMYREAIKDGASDAKRAADQFGNWLSEKSECALYSTSYAVSFGICFTSIVIARSIPSNSAIARGTVDGFKRAQEKADSHAADRETRSRKAKPKDSVPQKRTRKAATHFADAGDLVAA